MSLPIIFVLVSYLAVVLASTWLFRKMDARIQQYEERLGQRDREMEKVIDENEQLMYRLMELEGEQENIPKTHHVTLFDL